MFVKSNSIDSDLQKIVTASLTKDLDVSIVTYQFPSEYHEVKELQMRPERMAGIVVLGSDLDDFIQELMNLREEIKKRKALV